VSFCVVRRRHKTLNSCQSAFLPREADVRLYSPECAICLQNPIGQAERFALSGKTEKRLEKSQAVILTQPKWLQNLAQGVELLGSKLVTHTQDSKIFRA